MSRLSDFRAHVQSLEEVKSIINAMKNLAIIEIGRVSHYLSNQKGVVETVEAVARDFYSFHHLKPVIDASPNREVYIVIGSERGFCGGFNELLAATILEWSPHPPVIAIGRKLHSRLGGYENLLEAIDGPDSLEEIDYTVNEVIQALGRHPGMQWVLVYNEDTGSRMEQRTVRPFELLLKQEPVAYPFPPYLSSSPRRFSIELLDQYVFAQIYQAFFCSFMAENRQRLRHMDGAVSRIEKTLERLHLQLNVLRQEEIIEEIEVIFLNVDLEE